MCAHQAQYFRRALYYGAHLLKTWSVTQATVALSSGEAEYNADVKGASILLGFNSLLSDLGLAGSVTTSTLTRAQQWELQRGLELERSGT